MAGTEIKIETKVFLSTAEEITAARAQIAQSIDAYLREVSSLRSAWQGSSSDRVRAMAASIKTSGELLFQNMDNYSKTLNELAGIYTQTEKHAVESGKSLAFNGSSMR